MATSSNRTLDITRHTEYYCRLAIVILKGCTKTLRALILHHVDQSSISPKTLDNFLLSNKSDIENLLQREKWNIAKLFPSHGPTKLEEWDLSLLETILMNICKFSGTNPRFKLRLNKMRTIRNELFHSGDAYLDEYDYKMYSSDLDICMEECLDTIGNADLKREVLKIVQEANQSALSISRCMEILQEWFNSDKNIEKQLQQLINDLKEMHVDVSSVTSDITDIKSSVQRVESNVVKMDSTIEKMDTKTDQIDSKIDTVLSQVEKLLAAFPDLRSNTNIQDVAVQIGVENCNDDKEEEISSIIMEAIDTTIPQEEALTDSTRDKIKRAVREKIAKIFAGYEITSVKKKCVLIYLHCSSYRAFKNLVHQATSGQLNDLFKPVEEEIRGLEGCEHACLNVSIPEDKLLSCLEMLVHDLWATFGYNTEAELDAAQSTSTAQISDEDIDNLGIQNVALASPDQIEGSPSDPQEGRGKQILINVKPRSIGQYVYLLDAFTAGRVDHVFQNITQTLKEYFQLKHLNIEAKLLTTKPPSLDAETSIVPAQTETSSVEETPPVIPLTTTENTDASQSPRAPDMQKYIGNNKEDKALQTDTDAPSTETQDTEMMWTLSKNVAELSGILRDTFPVESSMHSTDPVLSKVSKLQPDIGFKDHLMKVNKEVEQLIKIGKSISSVLVKQELMREEYSYPSLVEEDIRAALPPRYPFRVGTIQAEQKVFVKSTTLNPSGTKKLPITHQTEKLKFERWDKPDPGMTYVQKQQEYEPESKPGPSMTYVQKQQKYEPESKPDPALPSPQTQLRSTVRVDACEYPSIIVDQDKSTCYAQGSCPLDDGGCLVTDCSNRRLKRLDSRLAVVECVDLPDLPRAVCSNSTEAAVCLPWSETIAIVSLEGRMRVVRQIRVGDWCEGVAWHRGEWLCGVGSSPSVLKRYGADGQERGSTRIVDENGKYINGGAPCQIVAQNDQIFMTIGDAGLVIVDAERFTTVKVVKEFYWTSGVCVGEAGDVFVCGREPAGPGMSRGPWTVKQFSKDGKFINTIISEEQLKQRKPWSLSYIRERSILVVTLSDSDEFCAFFLK